MKNTFLFLFTLFAIHNEIWAQEHISLFHRQYTTQDGLAGNTVTSISQDKTGFIWIGTTGGLVRFNGNRFLPGVEIDSLNGEPIPKHIVNQFQDRRGNLWFSTFLKGIYKINLQTGSISNHCHQPKGKGMYYFNAGLEDRKGRLWMGTYDEDRDIVQGFYRMDSNGEMLKKFTFCDSAEAKIRNNPNKVFSVSENKKGKFWLGTWSELVLFDPENEQFRRYPYPFRIPGDNPHQICPLEDENGVVWSGTWGYGLMRFNPKTNEWKSFCFQKETKRSNTKNIIHALIPKSKTEYWVGSNDGLLVFNTQTESFWKVTDVHGFDKGPLSTDILTLFEDRDGNIWVGTLNEGLICIPNKQFDIQTIVFKQGPSIEGQLRVSKVKFNPKNEGYLVLTSNFGKLFFVDRKSGFQQEILLDKNQLGSALSFGEALEIDGDRYLVESSNGLLVLDVKEQKLDLAENANVHFIQSKDHIHWKLDTDRKRVWEMTFSGIRFFQPDGKPIAFLPFANASETKFLKAAYRFFEDDWNRFWIQTFDWDHTYQQLLFEKVDGKLVMRDRILHDQIGFNDVICFEKNRAWATDYTHLYELTVSPLGKSKKQIVPIPPQIQFQNFYELMHVGSSLWLENLSSLVAFDLNTRQFRYFNSSNFIKGHPLNLSYLPETKEIALGSDGLVQLLKIPFRQENQVPLAIEKLVVNNQTSFKSIEGKAIELTYKENFISVEFSALTFSQSLQTQYQFRLLGLETKWNRAGKDLKATYTSLPPGSYTLEIKAEDPGFGWKTEVKQLAFVIAPPFWETWWFLLLAFLLIGLSVYQLIRWRIISIRKQEKMKSEMARQLAETEMKALRSQMNPHFIFNALNSISGFIVQNNTQLAFSYLSKFSKLIRLILENSRHNLVSLQKELESLRLYLEIEELRFSRKFEYVIDIEEDMDLDAVQIPPLIFQPFVENAIWHGLLPGTNPGKLTISVYAEFGDLHITITDNGVGRKKASERKTAEPLKSTSLGINITEERIHHAFPHSTIEIEDLMLGNESLGTKVHLTLPHAYKSLSA